MMHDFKRLLVYAGSDQPESALSRAFSVAMENDAALTLMDVVKPPHRTLGGLRNRHLDPKFEKNVVAEHVDQLLQRTSEYADCAVEVEVVVKVGDPATEIIRQVIRGEHDLVIKTADGFSRVGRLFGSIAKSLMRQCPCPVLVLKPAVHGQFDHVLAAVDVETHDEAHENLNRRIVSLAHLISQSDEAKLHVVSAWDMWGEQHLRRRAGDSDVDATLEQHRREVEAETSHLIRDIVGSSAGIDVNVVRGDPSYVIPMSVEQTGADLLVMGTVCRTGVAGFLIGNTAETVLSDVHCSVLALKPDGFQCPVTLADDEATTQPEETAP